MYRLVSPRVSICVVFLLSGCQPAHECQPLQKSGFAKALGSIDGKMLNGNELTVAYMIVEFPSGKHGLAMVARTNADSEVTPDQAKEGLARFDINRSIYRLPFCEEDASHDKVRSLFDRVLRKHVENTENE